MPVAPGLLGNPFNDVIDVFPFLNCERIPQTIALASASQVQIHNHVTGMNPAHWIRRFPSSERREVDWGRHPEQSVLRTNFPDPCLAFWQLVLSIRMGTENDRAR